MPSETPLAEQRGRGLRQTLAEILSTEDLDSALTRIRAIAPQKAVSPLFALFNHRDEVVRWGAISAMGIVVPQLAEGDMESARVVMRRLMWNLNDESGGIGWGCPEAMGEICASHEGLAEEYLRILFSYAREDGNFLELDTLQRGVLWGIGRAAKARPEMVGNDAPDMLPYLRSEDAVVRGLAAWVAGLTGQVSAREDLEALLDDDREITLFQEQRFVSRRIRDLAREAMVRLARDQAR